MDIRYLFILPQYFVPAVNAHPVSFARLALFAVVLLHRSAHRRGLSFQIEERESVKRTVDKNIWVQPAAEHD